MSERHGRADGLPRWLAVGIALAAVLAIISGAREDRTPPVTSPQAQFDTVLVGANGSVVDSLRTGPLRPDSVPVPAPTAAPRPHPKRRPAPTKPDSLRYSPRGCMPE